MEQDRLFGAGKEVLKRAEELRKISSPADVLLWNYLKDRPMGREFVRKQALSKWVVDYYSSEIRVAIDISEVSKNTDRNEEKEQHLKSLGVNIIQLDSFEVISNFSGVIEKINNLIAEAQPNTAPSSIQVPKGDGLEIIPAIDIMDGKCVRLTQGDYDQKTIYNNNPLDVAKRFEDAELRRLHLVDLDGAKAGAVKNWKVLEAIAGKTSLEIDFGGGIKTYKDVDIVFECGAGYATIGSVAVKDEGVFTTWLTRYGADKFILGADVRDEKIAVAGWLETTDIWIYDFIEKYIQKGVRQIFCTDVSKDGKMEGPSIDLYKNIVTKFPGLHFIASGGVSSIEDVDKLQEIGCKGVIIGKAIYENRITLSQLKQYRS